MNKVPPPPEKAFVTLKAMIVKDHKILLQEELGKNDKNWDLPGGRLDKGEDIHEALKREVFEETGVSVKSHSDLPIKVYADVGGDDSVVALVFKVELEHHNFEFHNEVISAEFLSKEEAQEKPLHSLHGKYILELFDLL